MLACALCRDDVSHTGEKIDWGKWAITGNDPEFGGTGNPDTGDDYGPAPGTCRLPFPFTLLQPYACHMLPRLHPLMQWVCCTDCLAGHASPLSMAIY